MQYGSSDLALMARRPGQHWQSGINNQFAEMDGEMYRQGYRQGYQDGRKFSWAYALIDHPIACMVTATAAGYTMLLPVVGKSIDLTLNIVLKVTKDIPLSQQIATVVVLTGVGLAVGVCVSTMTKQCLGAQKAALKTREIQQEIFSGQLD